MKKIVSMITASLLAGGVAQAAEITWGAAINNATSNDVSTLGTLVEGFNGAAVDVTVNTVVFTAGDILTGQGTAGNQLDQGGTTGDAAYDSLLNTVDFGGGANYFELTLATGLLTDGDEYLIQIWYCDDVRAVGDRVMQFGDGLSNTVNVDAAGPLGEHAIGTFTAVGTSQTLSFDAIGMGQAHINAYQIRAIPEPATLGLVAALGGGILFIRRRFMI